MIEYALEATQGSSLVQPAFVAAQAGPSTRSSKGAATFLGFVPEAIARDFCDVVFAHRSIVLSKTCVRRSLPWARSAFALQFTHVHLTLQGSSVKAINHLRTGPRISRQGQGVYGSAKHQAKHDAAVAQAVKTAWLTHVANLQLRDVQD